MKTLAFLLLLVVTISCTVTARPVVVEHHPPRKHMCTERYYSRDHHCRHEHPKHHGKHNHGKHKGHYK